MNSINCRISETLNYDGEVNIIPKSIQLIAGRTGKGYNKRKNRKGAFWEDRYHATAVKTGSHLKSCLAYIDLNMVRAGVVKHPGERLYGGYREIQNPKQRYTLINRQKLAALLGIKNIDQLTEYHRKWVGEILKNMEQTSAMQNGIQNYSGRGRYFNLKGKDVIILESVERKRSIILFLAPLLTLVNSASKDLTYGNLPITYLDKSRSGDYKGLPNLYEYESHYKSLARYIQRLPKG